MAQIPKAELLRAGLDLIAEAMARKQPDQINSRSPIALAGWVLEGMRALECLASEGDKIAADFLTRIARQAASDLNVMVKNDSKPFVGPVRQELTWPVLYSPQKFYRTDTKALVNELPIGEDYGLNLFGKARSLDLGTPGIKLALAVIKTIIANRSPFLKCLQHPSAGTEEVPGWVSKCRSLAPFNTDTVDQWIKVGWEMILSYTKDHPEDDKHLRPIGKHRGDKGHENTRSESAQIRYGIKEELAEAMKKLAKPAKPVV